MYIHLFYQLCNAQVQASPYGTSRNINLNNNNNNNNMYERYGWP